MMLSKSYVISAYVSSRTSGTTAGTARQTNRGGFATVEPFPVALRIGGGTTIKLDAETIMAIGLFIVMPICYALIRIFGK